MKGNSAVKVSLITCDLKSVNGPDGHSLPSAKVYNNPKVPLRACHESTQRVACDTGSRTEHFHTNKWVVITDVNIKVLLHNILFDLYLS